MLKFEHLLNDYQGLKPPLRFLNFTFFRPNCAQSGIPQLGVLTLTEFIVFITEMLYAKFHSNRTKHKGDMT